MNGYFKKRHDINQSFLDAGEELGVQKMWDYMQLALRDPAVMGKDTFGPNRLEKVFKAMQNLASEYHTAFTDDVGLTTIRRSWTSSSRISGEIASPPSMSGIRSSSSSLIRRVKRGGSNG